MHIKAFKEELAWAIVKSLHSVVIVSIVLLLVNNCQYYILIVNFLDGYYTFWRQGSKWLVIMDILENLTTS